MSVSSTGVHERCELQPAFIVGSSRSGTTLLIRLLRDYAGIGECRDYGMIMRFKDQLRHYGDIRRPENMRRLIQDILSSYDYRVQFRGPELSVEEVDRALPERTYAQLVHALLQRKAEASGAARWIDKTTFYAFRIPELHELFSAARVVHIYRDGRDVALSLFRMTWGPKNAYAAACYWKNHIEGARCGSACLLPEHFAEVCYERLLNDPVNEFYALVRFLGIHECLAPGWQDAVQDHVKANNYNKWKQEMPSHDVRMFERVAGDVLEACGYEVALPAEARTPLSTVEHALYQAQNLYRRLWAGESFRAGIRKRWQALCRRLPLRNEVTS
jgi:hypothetical protein